MSVDGKAVRTRIDAEATDEPGGRWTRTTTGHSP